MERVGTGLIAKLSLFFATNEGKNGLSCEAEIYFHGTDNLCQYEDAREMENIDEMTLITGSASCNLQDINGK